MAKLIATLYVNGAVYKPGDDVPADVAKLATNPALWDEVPAGQGDEPGDDSGYGGMTVADLKATIDQRNADRAEADQIAPEGAKKADLVAALLADDNA